MRFLKGKIGGIAEKFKKIPLKETLIFLAVGCLLLVLSYFAFHQVDNSSGVSLSGTETEKRLTTILQEFDGLNNVQVMIGETEEGEKSVVIMCDGEKNIQTIMEVREVAATIVGTHEKNVKIYFK